MKKNNNTGRHISEKDEFVNLLINDSQPPPNKSIISLPLWGFIYWINIASMIFIS